MQKNTLFYGYIKSTATFSVSSDKVMQEKMQKNRKWYRTPVAERQAMMDEHIAVGNKYPEVILNTTYSFGIHDEDFMLAFETDELIKFQDLIIELRTTRVSDYITSDTPMIVCVKKDIVPMIQSLG